MEEITNYSKEDIDIGNTPPKIYILCCSIRECFCISYSIRKTNNLYFHFHKEKILIKFEGNQLRYLGSDERSQALLLNKALTIGDNSNLESDSWIKSTPGIYIQKTSDLFSLIKYLESSIKEKFIFLIDEDTLKDDIGVEFVDFKSLGNLTEYFYIIPTYSISNANTDIIEKLKKFQFVQLGKINKTHDKILFINYQIDKFHSL